MQYSLFVLFIQQLFTLLVLIIIHKSSLECVLTIKLMKGKALRKQRLNGKIAASV